MRGMKISYPKQWASATILLLLVGIPIGWIIAEILILRHTVQEFPRKAAQVAFAIEGIEVYHQEHGKWPQRFEDVYPEYVDKPLPSRWKYTFHDTPALILFGPYHLVLTYRFGIEPGDTSAEWRCVQEGSRVYISPDAHKRHY